MKKYEVGSLWEAVNSQGSIGRVWLDSDVDGLQVWHYDFRYSDDVAGHRDWASSKRAAIELCRTMMFVGNRFKAEKVQFKRVQSGVQP